MNTFIYTLTLQKKYRNQEAWNENTVNIIEKHLEYLKQLKEANVLVLAGRTQYEIDHPDVFGIAIFTVNSRKEAEEIVNNDPAVKEKIMTAALHPFGIAVGGV